jgi:SSS family transporter
VGQIDIAFWVVLVAYAIIIVVIGVWSGKSNKGSEDFLTAGRSFGPLIGGAGLAATQMSAGTFVGTLGVHYLTGGSFLWIWCGMWLGWLINAIFVGPKFQSFNGITVPDYVGVRFQSKVARTISAILILVVYTVYLTAQYQAGGTIMQTLFGTPFLTGAIIITAITLVYTMMGGMRATTYQDFIHVIVMIAVVLFAVPFLLHSVGGIASAGQILTSLNPKLTHWFYGVKDLVGFGAAFGFSIAVAPYELARLYSLKDKRAVRLSIGVSFIFQATVGIGVALAGMAMRVIYPVLPTPDIASTIMSVKVLPPIIGALFMVTILSAITSTVSGIMIVSASAFSVDIYGQLIRKKASDREIMNVNRIAVLILGLIPVYLATKKIDIVQFVVILQGSLTASFFFAPVALGLNWKRGNAAGAIAAMVVGFITALTWFLNGKPFGIDPVIPGVLLSILLFVVVSLITPKPPIEGLRPFFKDTVARGDSVMGDTVKTV